MQDINLPADITIKIGEYTNKQGETKASYKKIGRVLQGNDGPFIALDATCLTMEINYLANKNRETQVMANIFSNERENTGGSRRGGF